MNLTNFRGSGAEGKCTDIAYEANLQYLDNFLRYRVKTEHGAKWSPPSCFLVFAASSVLTLYLKKFSRYRNLARQVLTIHLFSASEPLTFVRFIMMFHTYVSERRSDFFFSSLFLFFCCSTKKGQGASFFIFLVSVDSVKR